MSPTTAIELVAAIRWVRGNYPGESGSRRNEVRYCCFLTAGALAGSGHLNDMDFSLSCQPCKGLFPGVYYYRCMFGAQTNVLGRCTTVAWVCKYI